MKFKLNLWGYIKYRWLKWLVSDLCNKGDCMECRFGCSDDFGDCPDCGKNVVNCTDVHRELFTEARKTWGVE